MADVVRFSFIFVENSSVKQGQKIKSDFQSTYKTQNYLRPYHNPNCMGGGHIQQCDAKSSSKCLWSREIYQCFNKTISLFFILPQSYIHIYSQSIGQKLNLAEFHLHFLTSYFQILVSMLHIDICNSLSSFSFFYSHKQICQNI